MQRLNTSTSKGLDLASFGQMFAKGTALQTHLRSGLTKAWWPLSTGFIWSKVVVLCIKVYFV